MLLFFFLIFACPSNINTCSIHLTVLVTTEENTATTLYNLQNYHDSTQETKYNQYEDMITIDDDTACALRSSTFNWQVFAATQDKTGISPSFTHRTSGPNIDKNN